MSGAPAANDEELENPDLRLRTFRRVGLPMIANPEPAQLATAPERGLSDHSAEGGLTLEEAEEILRNLADSESRPQAAPLRRPVPIVPKEVGNAVGPEPFQRAEARYRTLVEQLPAVTFMAALEGGENELYVSPQIESLLGFSQKEWLEDPILWYRQLHPDDRVRWHNEFARRCADGKAFSLRVPVPGPQRSCRLGSRRGNGGSR